MHLWQTQASKRQQNARKRERTRKHALLYPDMLFLHLQVATPERKV